MRLPSLPGAAVEFGEASLRRFLEWASPAALPTAREVPHETHDSHGESAAPSPLRQYEQAKKWAEPAEAVPVVR